MEVVFWCSLTFLIYVFAGYPLTLAALQKIAGRRVFKRPIEPKVSVILVVRNERHRIERRLSNLFALDYPADKLEVIVSIDGATDGTESVVRKQEMFGVKVVAAKQHAGKAAAINRAMLRATGEIVLFADARQTFAEDALRKLVANFADASVGAATGELILREADSDSEAGNAIGIYWRYEKWIRSLESRLHSVVGATGAIYAIRRELFTPVPENTILDDVMIPMRIVMSGKRVVFDPDAKAFDVVSCCPSAEYQRKVRTLAGNYQLFATTPRVLAPLCNPIAWQVWSHKVGRLVAPFAMLTLFLSNALLVGSLFFAAVFVAQSLWYAVALVGHLDATRVPAEAAVMSDAGRKAA